MDNDEVGMFGILFSHNDPAESWRGRVLPITNPTTVANVITMTTPEPALPYAGRLWGDTLVYVAM